MPDQPQSGNSYGSSSGVPSIASLQGQLHLPKTYDNDEGGGNSLKKAGPGAIATAVRTEFSFRSAAPGRYRLSVPSLARGNRSVPVAVCWSALPYKGISSELFLPSHSNIVITLHYTFLIQNYVHINMILWPHYMVHLVTPILQSYRPRRVKGMQPFFLVLVRLSLNDPEAALF